MSDKTMRWAFVSALIVIGLLLLRPGVTANIGAYKAQPVLVTQPVMAVDNSRLYVLQEGKLYVYQWLPPTVITRASQNGSTTPTFTTIPGKLSLAQVLDAKAKP